MTKEFPDSEIKIALIFKQMKNIANPSGNILNFDFISKFCLTSFKQLPSLLLEVKVRYPDKFRPQFLKGHSMGVLFLLLK